MFTAIRFTREQLYPSEFGEIALDTMSRIFVKAYLNKRIPLDLIPPSTVLERDQLLVMAEYYGNELLGRMSGTDFVSYRGYPINRLNRSDLELVMWHIYFMLVERDYDCTLERRPQAGQPGGIRPTVRLCSRQDGSVAGRTERTDQRNQGKDG